MAKRAALTDVIRGKRSDEPKLLKKDNNAHQNNMGVPGREEA